MRKKGPDLCVLVEQGSDQAPAILPELHQVFPVYLYDQKPHGEFRLWTILQTRD